MTTKVQTLTTKVQTLTKLVNKQKGARTYQAAGKAHARAARAPKLSTLKVPAHRILSTLKTSPPGITSVTMKLKGLPQKNITDFYNQTRNEILKLLDQQEEKLPQEAMYMHIQTVQKYEEYDLWLKDKHHKALIVEKLDGNVITIADTTVAVSITSRTQQARKKVAKQQTQPNMEKHVSPESTTEQKRTVAEKAEQDRIVAEKAAAIRLQAQIRGHKARDHFKELQKNWAKIAAASPHQTQAREAHQYGTRLNLKEKKRIAAKTAAIRLQAQTRGHVQESQKKAQAQTHQYATRLSLKKMTKAEAEKFRPELREKLRAESSRVNEERTARIAAQKAEIPAEKIHSSGVSEKK